MTLSNINHGGKFAASFGHVKCKKAFSFREASPPDPPPGALLPKRPLRAPLLDPRYRLALRARHQIQLSHVQL